MLDPSSLEKAVEELNEAVKVMKRNTAVMSMQFSDSHYRSLIRLMIKLSLIKDWILPTFKI